VKYNSSLRFIKVRYAFAGPFLFLFTLVLVYPIFDCFYLSFHYLNVLYPKNTRFVGLDNWFSLFSDANFLKSLKVGLGYAFYVTIISYVIGLLIAVALDVNYPGRGVFRSLLLLPWVVPGVVVGLIWRWLFHEEFGILKLASKATGLPIDIRMLSQTGTAFWAVIIASVWRNSPFLMLMLLAALQAIPQDVKEAARIDGATGFQTFWYVIFPYLRPVTIVSTILIFIWTFNNFDLIWTMTNGGPADATTTVPLYAYLRGFRGGYLSYAASISVSMFMLLLTFMVVYLRSYRSYY